MPGDLPTRFNHIPSPEQRHGGTSPQAAEGGAGRKGGRQQLARPPTMRPPQHTQHPQVGQQRVGSGDGVRDQADPAGAAGGGRRDTGGGGGGGQAGTHHPNPPGRPTTTGRNSGPPSKGHNGVREEGGQGTPGTALQRPLQGHQEGAEGLPHRGGRGGADSHRGPAETPHRGGGGHTGGTTTERPTTGRPSCPRNPGGASGTTQAGDTRHTGRPAEREEPITGTSGYH